MDCILQEAPSRLNLSVTFFFFLDGDKKNTARLITKTVKARSASNVNWKR